MMRGKKSRYLVLWALLGGLHTALAQEVSDDTPEIATLLSKGEVAKAYALGEQQLSEQGGDPEFDFWFGLATLEHGRPQEAIFAFERVLEEQPWNHRARLELGRAYYLIGNYERAKTLFEAVLATDPPQQVKENVEKFLDSISRSQESRFSSVTASVQLKAGTDSNINSGTKISTVTLPIGISWPLSDASRETRDNFKAAELNLDYSRLINKRWAFFTGASIAGRHNNTYINYDTSEYGVRLGTGFNLGGGSFRMPLQWQRMELGRRVYRDNSSFGLEWSQTFAENHQLGIFSQKGHISYRDQPTSDAAFTLYGSGWGCHLSALPITVSLSGYSAQEDAQLNHLGRDYTGVKVSGQWVPRKRHQFELSWAQQKSKYADIQPVFATVRRDTFNATTFSWTFLFTQHWQLAATVEASRNESNISMFGYDRYQRYVSVKYGF